MSQPNSCRPFSPSPQAAVVERALATEKLERLTLISMGVEALISPGDWRREFFRRAGAAGRAYKALLPHERAAPYLKPVAALHVLSEAIRGKLGPVDISAVSRKKCCQRAGMMSVKTV
jgi:type I restriction enzyme R subunit